LIWPISDAGYTSEMSRVLVITGLVAATAGSCNDAPRPTRAVYFDVDLPRSTRDARRWRGDGVDRSVALHGSWDARAHPSLAVTPAHRRRGATTANWVAALWHVERNAERWKLDAAGLDELEVAHVHDTGRGAIVAKLRQRIGGVEVARTALTVVMDRDRSRRCRVAHAAKQPATPVTLGARAAIERALDDSGAHAKLVALPDRGGYQRFAAAGLAVPARVKRVLFPVGTQLVPAWSTELGIRDGQRIAGYRHVHAADDGRLLFRASLSDDATFTYRVFADSDLRFQDGPQGDYTPHPTGTPDSFEPAFVAPGLVSVDGFNTNPNNTSDPWLLASATSTLGNNVDAYADIAFPSGYTTGDLRATTTGPRAFDRTYDVTAAPNASESQRMAAVTHLFYVNNWLHDYFYDSASTGGRNARRSTSAAALDAMCCSEGGLGGTTRTCSRRPRVARMQMFVFSAPPVRWTRRHARHADHRARVGPLSPSPVGRVRRHRVRVDERGLGDFIALFTTVQASDNLQGTWGLAGYALRSFTANSAYFGIRRYRARSIGAQPLACGSSRRWHFRPARRARTSASCRTAQQEVRSRIWCSMLWEGAVAMLRSPLLVRRGEAPVRRLHRDRHDRASGNVHRATRRDPRRRGRDQPGRLRPALRRSRGVDSAAVRSPSVVSFDGSGVVELPVTGALDVAALTIDEDPGSCDGDDILDVGETGRVIVTVRNVGAEALTGPTITVSSNTPGVVFPRGPSATLGSIEPFATRSASVPIQLDETPTLVPQIDLRVVAEDSSAALSSIERTGSATANLDVTPVASMTDTFDEPELVWTAAAGFGRCSQSRFPRRRGECRGIG
jgi:hypothetical protein